MWEFEGGKRKPYGLGYWLSKEDSKTGKVVKKNVRVTFATKSERTQHRKEIERKRLGQADVLERFDPALYRELEAQMKRLHEKGYLDVSITQVFDFFFEKYSEQDYQVETVTLAQACDEQIEDHETKGATDISHLRGTFGRIRKYLGDDILLTAIRNKDVRKDVRTIQSWINSMYQEEVYQTEGGPRSIKNHLKRLKTLMNVNIELGRLEKNPCLGVVIKEPVQGEAEIIPVAKLIKHIEANIEEDLSYCAVEMVLFQTAMRSSMMAPTPQKKWRVTKDMFYPEAGMIIVPARVMKVKKKDLVVEGLEPAVFEWMELINDRDWQNKKTAFHARRRAASERSGITIPTNCARKSGGTYLKILEKSRRAAAKRMGHSQKEDTKIFKQHYEGYRDYDKNILTHQMAVDYFAISPGDFL